MPNILADALNSIQSLIQNQKISIYTYSIENNNGLPMETLKKIHSTSAHIQPITPNELKKYTDSTIDSSLCYKFFIVGNEAKITNSLDLPLEKSYIKWGDKNYKIYAKKDWHLNGWIVIMATLTLDVLDTIVETQDELGAKTMNNNIN